MFESKKSYRDSRADFERQLNLLGELMREGRMKVAEGLRNSMDGITKVRYSPNNRIDLNTVNEMVRTMAMMVTRKENYDNGIEEEE